MSALAGGEDGSMRGGMESYPRAAVKPAMKVQDAILVGSPWRCQPVPRASRLRHPSGDKQGPQPESTLN